MTAKTAQKDATVMAICENRNREVGLAVLSLQSPTLQLSQFCDLTTFFNTLSKIYIHQPRKVLFPTTSANSHLLRFIKKEFTSIEIDMIDRQFFDETKGGNQVKELSDRNSIDVLVDSKYLAQAAAGALLHYLNTDHNLAFLPQTLRIDFYTSDSTVLLDPMTIKALELLEPDRGIISSNFKSSSGAATSTGGSKTGGMHGNAPGGAQRGRGPIKSLFDVLNHTQTPHGARLLKANLLQPPCDLNTILLRQSAVSALLDDEKLYFGLQTALGAFTDPNPILAMLARTPPPSLSSPASSSSSAGPSLKDLTLETLTQVRSRIHTFLKLKRSLAGIQPLRTLVSASAHPFFKVLLVVLSHPDLATIYKLLLDSMADINIATDVTAETSATKRKSIIQRDVVFALKQGLNGLLDAARRVYSERIDDIKELVEGYKAEYPDLRLSLSHSSSRGYFLRVFEDGSSSSSSSLSPRSAVPGAIEEEHDDDVESHGIELPENASARSLGSVLPRIFVHRVKRGSRIEFSSEDLVALNGRLEESMNEILLLSGKLLLEVHAQISSHIGCLYNLAEMIALLDMVHSFATFAALSKEDCICPDLNEKGQILISRGFHPIMLAHAPSSTHSVIPNSIHSSSASSYFHIITGKNNSGKTTFLLQIASLVLLAHIGCFIPAKFASITLVDRIMTRISSYDHEIASTDPTASSSAFFNEMKEVAYILDCSTPKSLVLLDEIGKSTSSEDGIPLCMAISEHLMQRKITTFFATHFLDMASKLHDMYPQILVHKMTSEKLNDHVTGSSCTKAKYALIEGCEEDSGYGIELAAHAGWPASAVEQAHLIRSRIIAETSSQRGVSMDPSRNAQCLRLKRMVIEQLEIAKNASMDPVSLHMFLHKLAVRYRQKMDELTGEVVQQ